jgi:branched-subunit amino acid ABC-type transport system permease component
VSDYTPFLVIGIATGSLFGLAAMGLVLTYKTSGIFNFAHGAVAALAAYAYYDLRTLRGLPTLVAFLIAVVLLPPLVALVMERIARVLARGSTTPRIVATVGLQLGITGLLLARYGAAALPFPALLPAETFTLFGVIIGVDQATSFVVGAIGAIALFVFFRSSRLGVRMRAVVDDPDLLSLSGTSPFLVRTASWLIGSWFAALSGVLLAPTIGLDAILLTLLVVQAFGAAAIGLFDSLPMTYVGGLILGVLAALSTMNPMGWSAMEGLSTSVPFLVLFVVLLVAGRRRLVDPGDRTSGPATGNLHISTRAKMVLGAVVVCACSTIPFLAETKLPVFLNGLAFVVVFYSLSLLVRMSGQVSLAHASFVAVGAATFSHAAVGWGLPWLLAVLAAGLVTVPIGAVVAIPAIRLSGLFLALATLGFGLLLEKVAYTRDWMFGVTGSLKAPRPSVAMLDTDRGFFFVLLTAAVLTGVLVSLVHGSRLGRLLRALADSPTTLTTLGLSINQTRVIVFTISAFIAGVGGALVGGVSESVSGAPFTAFVSMTWLAVLAMSGRSLHATPVLAALLVAVVPAFISNETLIAYLPVAFGLGAVAAAMLEASRAQDSAPSPALSLGLRAQQRLGASGPVHARLSETTQPPALAPPLLAVGPRATRSTS